MMKVFKKIAFLIVIAFAITPAITQNVMLSGATNPYVKYNFIVKDSITVGDMENDATQNRIMVWDSVNMKINYRQVTTLPSGAGATDLSFSGASSPVTLNSSTGTDVTFTAGGINTFSATGSDLTITATEVDGSVTNELQTIANTSDATSHTAILSNSGGSLKLAEGTNITLTTTGTSADGIVTIASPDYSGTYLKLDQTTPQTVSNGAPIFNSGLESNDQVDIDGVAQTAAMAEVLLDMSQTWNTSGAPTGIKLNVTNTASTGSRLMDLQVGGVSHVSISPKGFISCGSSVGFTGLGAYDGSSFLASGASLGFRSNAINQNIYTFYVQATNARDPTSGTIGHLTFGTPTFSPTSGTAIYNTLNIAPIINQTGGANGITRGIYHAPSLTAAADYYFIQSETGKVKLTGLAQTGSMAENFLDQIQTWNTSGAPIAHKIEITNTASGTGARIVDYAVGGISQYQIDVKGKQIFDYTYTAPATTGAQVINKVSGSVNFAAAATSLVVTNSLVTTNSIVMCQVSTNDATMKSVQCVIAAGSFTLYPNNPPTAETKVTFFVIN